MGTGLEVGGRLEVWSLGATRSRPPWQGAEGAGVASQHHAAAARISDSLTAWRGVNSLAWESISPASGGLSVSASLSLSRLSCVMSIAGWASRGGSKGERGSRADCVCACVSVSEGWLLEYKWDVIIHLNQGHMLGPRVKCCERNEALYCICRSAQEIKPGTFHAPHEILRVTFKDSVDINWLYGRPYSKDLDITRYCYHECFFPHLDSSPYVYFLFPGFALCVHSLITHVFTCSLYWCVCGSQRDKAGDRHILITDNKSSEEIETTNTDFPPQKRIECEIKVW